MKHFTIYILSVLLVLAACEREAIPTNERETSGEGERITLRFEAPVTRSEIDGTTGAMTWTSGDQIAVCCTDGATKRYETVTVNTSASTADITMGASDSRCDYAVFPASAVPASPTTAQFTAPAVVFPTMYDIRGKNAETYSPCPMVAVNSGSTLDFYHVGALVRIQLTDVPEGTAAIRVTFTGMTHVTGTYNVSGAGTAGATLSLASGTGNTVTVTIDANDEYVNLPIPQGDYSALTGLSVEALDSSNATLGTANQAVSWSTFTRGRGRATKVVCVADIVALSSLAIATSEYVDIGIINPNSYSHYTGDTDGTFYGGIQVVYSDGSFLDTYSNNRTLVMNVTTSQKFQFSTTYYYINRSGTPYNTGTSTTSTKNEFQHQCYNKGNSNSSHNNALWVRSNSKGITVKKHRWYTYSSNPIHETEHYLILGDLSGTSATCAIEYIVIIMPKADGSGQRWYSYYPFRRGTEKYFYNEELDKKFYVCSNTVTPTGVSDAKGYLFRQAEEEEEIILHTQSVRDSLEMTNGKDQVL